MPVPKGLDLDAVIHEPELSEEVGRCAPLAQDNARGALWPLCMGGAGRIRCPRTAAAASCSCGEGGHGSRHTHGFHLEHFICSATAVGTCGSSVCARVRTRVCDVYMC